MVLYCPLGIIKVCCGTILVHGLEFDTNALGAAPFSTVQRGWVVVVATRMQFSEYFIGCVTHGLP